MRNITIALDDDMARKARVLAAEQDLSLSRYIAELLRREVERKSRYATAMNDFLSSPLTALREDPSVPYPSREETYDRPGIR